MMPPKDPSAEVELLRATVARYFPIYDIKVTYEAVTMLVNAEAETLDESFEALRKDLRSEGFIPFIKYGGGEHAITIVRRPLFRKRNIQINQILLAGTFLTTTLAGMVLWSSYSNATHFFTLDNLLWGALFFALPLMAILGVHELAHYYASKRHDVEASLPFFIPFIPPFGTMGAFISMRDPMPNRKALVDIGVAGPLGGLAVTIPVAIIGLYLTSLGQPVSGPVGEEGTIAIIIQPLYQLLTYMFPLQEDLPLHPTGFAAWVGFLVTAINLLPAGQLDGGHISRGLLGKNAKYLSYATGAILIVASLFIYSGWLLFALLVVLLGLRHPAPLNDISKPGPRATVLGVLAMIILAVTFVPTPIVSIFPDHSFDMEAEGGLNITALPGEVVEVNIVLNNTGNSDSIVDLSLSGIPGTWRASIFQGDPSNATDKLTVKLDYESSANITVRLIPEGVSSDVTKIYLYADSGDVKESLTLNVTVDA